MANCPVCETEYIPEQIEVCPLCGWDLTVYPPTLGEIPQSYREKEQNKLAWARETWIKLQLQNQTIPQVDYSKLRELLAEQKWLDANRETLLIMLKISNKDEGKLTPKDINFPSPEDIYNFPCEDFKKIDYLWKIHSNGRFGFSIQKHIWRANNCDINKFREVVKWPVVKEYDFILSFSLDAPFGHLPVIDNINLLKISEQLYIERNRELELIKDKDIVRYRQIQVIEELMNKKRREKIINSISWRCVDCHII